MFSCRIWSCEDCLHMIAAVGKATTPEKSRFFTIHHSFTHQSHSEKGSPVTNKRAACRGENTKKGQMQYDAPMAVYQNRKAVGCLDSTRNRSEIGIEYFPFLLFLIFYFSYPSILVHRFSCFNLGRFGVQSFGRSSAVSKVRVHPRALS